MLFWIEKGRSRIFVDALLNCGRYYVLFYDETGRIQPEDWMKREAEGYLRLFTDKPIEF